MESTKLQEKTVQQGHPIWVIERNKDGTIRDLSCHIYVAEVLGNFPGFNFIIVCPFPDHEGIARIMSDAVKSTARWGYTKDLSVFPKEDCFATKADCENQIKKERK